jgi:N-carbamoyl-L-amino-acid hydrolase
MAAPEEMETCLSLISGAALEGELITLAALHGEQQPPTVEQPLRYAPRRLALTEEDTHGRQHVAALMSEAGLEVDHSHPLALIGTLPGTDRDLAPVTVLSHFDTVPKADMYDGVLGVLGGIAVARGIREAGLEHRRDVQVLAVTGEESSRFNIALFGSKAVFLGLTDKDLLMSDSDDRRIMDELDSEEVAAVTVPLYGGEFWQKPIPHAAIELHVEQSRRLEQTGHDLGVVEVIAAASRHEVLIGDMPLQPDKNQPTYINHLELEIAGRADHSGATPMGLEHRADGFVEAANVLLPLMEKGDTYLGGLDVSDIVIIEPALNKIPGQVTVKLSVGGNSEFEVAEQTKKLQEHVASVNELHTQHPTAMGANPLSLKKPDEVPADALLDRPALKSRYVTAFKVVRDVNAAADARSEQNVVGTVGTFEKTADGRIKLGVDVRGVEAGIRDEAVAEIGDFIENLNAGDQTVIMTDPLPGSGLPVNMDADLVRAARAVIEKHAIGSAVTMFSAAGHDTQNAARAGIPSVMLFVPSREGRAHNPEAYTSPDHLERGVKALMALVMHLAE